MIRFNCPKCGKRYAVGEEMAGKKGKCSCDAIITIPTVKVSEGTHDVAEVERKPSGFESSSASVASSKIQGRATYKEQEYEQSFSTNKPFTQDTVRKNFWSRLIGCSIGTIVFALVMCIRDGLGALFFILIFGAGFTFVMCWMGHKNDIRCLEDKKYYEEQKARFRFAHTPQYRIALGVLVLGLLIWAVTKWRFAGNEQAYRQFVTAFFTTRIPLKLTLLAMNIPIFILIGRIMVGSWKRYWQVAKWHFIPFHIFVPSWWKFLGTVRIEDIYLAGAVDSLCIGTYLLEYLLIKVLFLT